MMSSNRASRFPWESLASTDLCTYHRWHQTALYTEWSAQNGQVKTKFPFMSFDMARKEIVSESDNRSNASMPKAFFYITGY